jgi:phosphomannomutase
MIDGNTAGINDGIGGQSKESLSRLIEEETLRVKPNVLIRREEDGAVLFDPDCDRMGVVNITGAALLSISRDRFTMKDLCAFLEARYLTKSPFDIKTDVKTFLISIAHFLEARDDQQQ